MFSEGLVPCESISYCRHCLHQLVLLKFVNILVISHLKVSQTVNESHFFSSCLAAFANVTDGDTTSFAQVLTNPASMSAIGSLRSKPTQARLTGKINNENSKKMLQVCRSIPIRLVIYAPGLLLITVVDEVCPLLSDCLPLAGMSCTERLSRVFHSFRRLSVRSFGVFLAFL